MNLRENRCPDGEGPWSITALKREAVSGDVMPVRMGLGEGPVRVNAAGLSRDDDGERDSDQLIARNAVAQPQDGSNPSDSHPFIALLALDWQAATFRAYQDRDVATLCAIRKEIRAAITELEAVSDLAGTLADAL